VLEKIGELRFGKLFFEVFEAAGGHVPGECVYLERSLGLAFTGDILVNIKGFTKPQADFNRLAPYLMTSVDTDPALAARERAAIEELLGSGKWTIFGGHGAPIEREGKTV
jgi:glyoxylase-like metal-dependent hydrolase (beta-lactamase superfamily II)